MTTETNEVRIIGIKPAHNTDDIPIRQDTQADLQALGYLMAYDSIAPAWVELRCNIDGNILCVSS